MVAGFKCSDTFFNFGHSLVEITSRCPHHDEHAGSVTALLAAYFLQSIKTLLDRLAK